MKTKINFVLFIILVVMFFYFLPEPSANKTHPIPNGLNGEVSLQKSKYSDNFIIRKVRLYDGYTIFNSTDILIEKGKVKRIAQGIENPANLPELSAHGKTLLPGLVDAHTHAYGNALQDALNFGVTTELDMYSTPESSGSLLKNRDNPANTQQADLFTASILATAPGGHGTEYGFKIPVLDSVDQADDFVTQRIDDGADYIKAVYNSEKASRHPFPSISKSILAALINSAHQHNKMLVVHIDNLVSAKEAIELGADGVIHSFMDAVVDQEFITLMKEHHAFIIPTLSVESVMAQRSFGEHLLKNSTLNSFLNHQQRQQLRASFPDFGIPKSAFENALTSVKLLLNAQIPILAGTDAPNPGTSHGVSLHGELELLVSAGLSNEQAIHSATSAAREFFPIGLRGSLLQDAYASMVLVDGNPFERIEDSQKIVSIWKNGHYFERIKTQSKPANKKLEPGIITSFSTSLEQVKIGEMLVASTDKVTGGNSVVSLSRQVKSITSDHFLLIDGVLEKGFMFPWSGVSLLLSDDYQKGADLSRIKAVSFEAKSIQGSKQLSVLLFQPGSYRPFEVTLNLSKQWQRYNIPLSQFANLDVKELSNISFVNNKTLGKFQIALDNLRFE